MVIAIERFYAALTHHSQQERVHLRPGTIDFVEEKSRQLPPFAEQGSRRHCRFARIIEIGVINEIGGHEIDGAFDTLRLSPQCTGYRSKQGGLAYANTPLQQGMSPREHRNAEQMDCMILAHDGFLDLAFKRLGQRPGIRQNPFLLLLFHVWAASIREDTVQHGTVCNEPGSAIIVSAPAPLFTRLPST